VSHLNHEIYLNVDFLSCAPTTICHLC